MTQNETTAYLLDLYAPLSIVILTKEGSVSGRRIKRETAP
jgi:hypothetical protein